MPSPTDGSHQLPIPTDELVVGEVLPPRMPCGPAVAFQGPRHLCVQRSGCGPPRCGPCQSAAWDARGHLRALGTCVVWFPGHWPFGIAPLARPLRAGEGVSGPSAPAPSPRGEACQGPRHLRYPPLTQFPGGRPPPCSTECPRSCRCPRRGRWRPRSPVLRRAPRPSTCSGR